MKTVNIAVEKRTVRKTRFCGFVSPTVLKTDQGFP